MTGSLEEKNLEDFTGGLNERSNKFQLEDNESPSMMNMLVDPRGGFYTRRGTSRANITDIHIQVGIAIEDWDPRNAEVHILAAGAQLFIANNDSVYASSNGLDFSDMGIVATAPTHLADFASWGDISYIVCGPDNPSQRQNGQYVDVTNVPFALANAEAGAFNDDYTTPAGGVMPQCEHVETHSGYVFCANTMEDIQGGDTNFPNRLRWSHPASGQFDNGLPRGPEDFATEDFLDIEIGGGEITALQSFRDHLLIFKTDSMWALYGYNSDSWQLIKVSTAIGVVTPTAVTRNEQAVFFYSASDQGGIFAYQGQDPTKISSQLNPVIEAIQTPGEVWVAWANSSVLCSMPWSETADPSERALFAWDPDVGGGAWTRHQLAQAHEAPVWIQCVVERGERMYGGTSALLVVGDTSAVVEFQGDELAIDTIYDAEAGVVFDSYYKTGWRHVDWPDRKKSWRRSRVIMNNPKITADVEVNTYADYNESDPVRTHILSVDVEGNAFWRAAPDPSTDPVEPGGFRWGDGTPWGQPTNKGSQVERVQPAAPGRGGHGVSRAIQLEFKNRAQDPVGAAWGIDLIILKYYFRRATT